MSGRERAPLWLVALLSTTLGALTVLTVTPAASPVKAATPPQYYAIALGLVHGIGGSTAINDSGVIAGQFGVTNQGNQGFARVTARRSRRCRLGRRHALRHQRGGLDGRLHRQRSAAGHASRWHDGHAHPRPRRDSR